MSNPDPYDPWDSTSDPWDSTAHDNAADGGDLDYDELDYDDVDYEPADHEPADHEPADHEPADHEPADHEPADHELGRMAQRLDAAVPPGAASIWVRLLCAKPLPTHPDPEPTEPDTVELDGDISALMGWTAPSTCLAVAIVASGQARRLGPDDAHGLVGADPLGGHPMPARPGSADPDARRGDLAGPVRVVCIVDRWGRMASRTHVGDEAMITDPAEGGRLLDALRRTFGLPTAPPAVPSGQLVDRMWLGAVAAAAREGEVALTWEQVRRLHPAVEVLRTAGLPITDQTIGAAMRVAPKAWTWDRIRTQAAEGSWGDQLMPPRLADWMDEGMFSRWVLDDTRTTDELFGVVSPWLAPSARRRLRRAIA
jgi:hypothetical protein